MFENLKNKKILILGFGLEGQSSFLLLKTLFPEINLGVADQKVPDSLDKKAKKLLKDYQPSANLGPQYLNNLNQYQLIIKTPGIPSTLPEIEEAKRRGIKITSQTELFLENCPGTIVGVTGTKGKSTTSTLIYQILKLGGIKAQLVGNIGKPSLPAILKATKDDVFVYELSSHQLADVKKSPHIAVILNIFQEHLDYYRNFNEYLMAKANITRFQSKNDYLVYNDAFPELRKVGESSKAKKLSFGLDGSRMAGCSLKNGWIVFKNDGSNEEKIINVNQVPLSGGFNLQNVMAATCAAKVFGLPNENISLAISKFKPLPHRLEYCGAYRGISFYDDSISTIPESAMAAIDALGKMVQTILLGGFERRQNYTKLAQKIISEKTIKNIILFPATGQRVWKTMKQLAINDRELPKHFFVSTMKEAVSLAYRQTEKGKICLLSPASPSFGLFKDYKDRGNQFKKYIKLLAQ